MRDEEERSRKIAVFESRSEAEVEFAIFRQLLTTSEDNFSIAEMAGEGKIGLVENEREKNSLLERK